MQTYSTSSPNNSTPSPALATSDDIASSASPCSNNTRNAKGTKAPISTSAAARLPPSTGPVPFALPNDGEWLAPPVCLLREQLEVFAATPQDIAEKKSGSKPLLGAVGIRCRHCASDPNKSKGAVMFPKSISHVHQAVRNFQRYHMFSCPRIPAEIKSEMKSFKPKQSQSKRNANQYWIDSCRDVFGMVDVGGADTGPNTVEKTTRMHIRFRDGWVYDPKLTPVEPRVGGEDGTVGVQQCPQQSTAQKPSSRLDDVPSGDVATADRRRARTFSDESDFSFLALGGIEGVEFDQRIDDLLDNAKQLSGDGATAAAASSVAAVAEPSVADSAGDVGAQAIVAFDHRRSSIRASLLEPVSNLNCSSGDFVVNSADYLLKMLHESAEGVELKASNSDFALQRSQRTGTGETTDLTPCTLASSDGYMKNTSSASNSCSIGNAASLASMIRNQHIMACQTALSLVQTSKQSNSCPSLVDFGRMIYSAFIGSEPPDPSECNEGRQSAAMVEETRESFACTALENDEISESRSLVGSAQQKRQRDVVFTASKRPVPAPHMGILESKMREADLPVQLSILISSLINSNDGECTERYQSIEELEQDLLGMVVNPDRDLFDLPPERQTGRLFDHDDHKLYGRETQRKQLTGPLQRVLQSGGPREAVYVSGSSGSGKSSLVHSQIASSVHSLNGRVIAGKFDALRQRQPCEVICQALDDFCSSLSTASDGASFSIRASIVNAVDVEGLGALSGLMPSLQGILPPEIVQRRRLGRRSSGLDGVNQLFYHLNLFITAISTTSTPILFFFDDLQWCDEAAFDIFTRIVSERSLASFLFVGCYRDDEINEMHPLKQHRQDLLEAGIFTSDISLGAFDKMETNEMISDLLHLPKRITRSLSDCVSAKTSGNILFMKQFLLSLCDEGLLWYSASARRWYWDTVTIQSKEVTDSVADLITSKMIGLDVRAQDLLKLIACLGFECKVSTLSKLNLFAEKDLMEREMLLKILTIEGMLSQVGINAYKFPHDKVHQAAYHLIAPLDRAGLHLDIGRQLRQNCLTVAQELDGLVFTIVDQFSRGLELVTDHDEEIEVARLCLMAGKKAIAKSSVGPALIYHLQGTALLRESDWGTHYDLSLELFTCCVEAQCVSTNYDGVHITQQAIDLHARCIHDKLPSFLNLISTLSAQGRFEDAVDAGLAVLAELGESVRKNADQSDMLIEFKKVKHLLDISLDQEGDAPINEIILRSPSIDSNPGIDKQTAKTKIAAMRLIAQLMRTTYQFNQFLQITINLRAIQLALSYGLSQYSISSFASYGVFLARRFMKIEEASAFGKLSLDLVERFGAMDEMPEMPRIYLIVYSYIFPCVRPVQSLIPELRRAYDIAMRSGSIDVAMSNARQISHLLLSCDGMPSLEKASEEVAEFTYQMKKHKQKIVGSCLPILQYFLILMNDGGKDPSILSGRVMNYESSLKEALSRGDLMTILECKTIRLRLAFIFGKYDEAGALVKDVLRLHQKFPSVAYQSDITGDALYCGLTAAVLGCSDPHGADEWHEIAESTLKTFERFAAHSEWNFGHRVELMKAEIAYFMYYDNEAALEHYKAAVDLAEKHKFPGERALALERMAIFCEGTFQTDLARGHYKEAERAYRDWGAIRKADHVACSLIEVS